MRKTKARMFVMWLIHELSDPKHKDVFPARYVFDDLLYDQKSRLPAHRIEQELYVLNQKGYIEYFSKKGGGSLLVLTHQGESMFAAWKMNQNTDAWKLLQDWHHKYQYAITKLRKSVSRNPRKDPA